MMRNQIGSKPMCKLASAPLLSISPFLQPIIDGADGRVIGAEFLTRVFNGDSYTLTPVQLEIIENKDKINNYSIELLEKTRKHFLCQHKKLPDGFLFSLNIDICQMKSLILKRAINDFIISLDGKIKFQLEIIERSTDEIDSVTLGAMAEYNRNGINIALDDFGSSISSLKYFGIESVSSIKLDPNFTVVINGRLVYEKLLEALVIIANKCKLTIIAEGIEDTHQEVLLREIGIQFFQGFLYSKPISIEDFSKQFL
ncbi:EAL domain-containing protein [Obesumbacterium proteus]|uniref:EAL domain-containing protein n=1 Tax=Obesumbacterium proteus TaxID=82983 RepID=UPI001F45CD13|nr:EAL domain-containing protein [Obesumbacterium proteus]MCE9885883.1 EAL domain-containing protein [Obesumbacterium proteus]MCE9918241.1 EAL domain-containing protein [Obesumbacterium proteus]MCE9929998.1 EAL domain-containing protein [Obesumbacterium proteus]MCG2875950.1 EAL domain-containing protein [Obesumbacterium proteus]